MLPLPALLAVVRGENPAAAAIADRVAGEETVPAANAPTGGVDNSGVGRRGGSFFPCGCCCCGESRLPFFLSPLLGDDTPGACPLPL